MSPFSPGRVARVSASKPWVVIAAWVVASIAFMLVGGMVTGVGYVDDFTNVQESQTGRHLLLDHGLSNANASETLVFQSDTLTVADPAFREAVNQTLANVQVVLGDDIGEVINYYNMPLMMGGLVAQDGHMLLMPISLSGGLMDYVDVYEPYMQAVENSGTADVTIRTAGDISAEEINQIISHDMSKDVSIGLPVAAVVLIVVFGALLAAGIPLVLGVLTILISTGIAHLIGTQVWVEQSTLMMVSMISMAVGIDYSLFLLERYREERRLGAGQLDAIERSAATAGKAVIFSGGSVLLALSSLALIPITIFRGMGMATVAAVAIAVFGSITLVPALIRLCGDWINFPRRGLIRKLRVQDQTGVSQFSTNEQPTGIWSRFSHLVMRYPVAAIVATVAILIACTIPVFDLELGQPSITSMPDSEYRTTAMLIGENYGQGQEEPIRIAIATNGDTDATVADANRLADAVRGDARFASAEVVTSEDGAVVSIDAVLVADPFSPAGGEAVQWLRNDVIPSVMGDRAADAYVTGVPSLVTDFNDTLTDHLPEVFAFVLGCSFLLLMVSFRSVVVPAVSIVMNMLSVGAAYGAVVLVFQKGWMHEALGFTQVPTIVNWLPVMLFCILFGLSMDYHVFLLSRVREAYDHGHSANESIARGVQATGKIITGAALIMVAVFGTFAMGRFSSLQQVGFGLGIAVLLDATLIRMILVPAVFSVLGDKAWYFPRVLNWIPRLHIEGNLEPIQLRSAEGAAD